MGCMDLVSASLYVTLVDQYLCVCFFICQMWMRNPCSVYFTRMLGAWKVENHTHIFLYIFIWMGIRYQVNVKWTFFFFFFYLTGGGADGILHRKLGDSMACLFAPHLAYNYNCFLDVFRHTSPLQKCQRWKILLYWYNLSPLLPVQGAHRQFSN